MRKVVQTHMVDDCRECPDYDYDFIEGVGPGYLCLLEKKEIPGYFKGIPDWCPLEIFEVNGKGEVK